MMRRSGVMLLAGVLAGAHSVAQGQAMLNCQGRVVVNGTNYTGTAPFQFALVDAGSNQASQATATATVVAGAIVSYTVTFGGSGYATPPSVTVLDASGAGATATAQISSQGVVTNILRGSFGNANYSASPTVLLAAPPVAMGYTTFWSNGVGSVSLPVVKGLYSVMLGDASLAGMAALPDAVFTNSDMRLRVWFDAGAGMKRMSPDLRLGSAGYAVVAGTAQGVAAGGITSSMISSGAVGVVHLATGAVTSNAIAVGAVSGGQIASNTITADNIMNGSLMACDLTNANRLGYTVIPDPHPYVYEHFGISAAAVGANQLVMGASYRDVGGIGRVGQAYLFDKRGALIRQIDNPYPLAEDYFGCQVAAVGSNLMVIGAYCKDIGTNNYAGQAYLYTAGGNLIAVVTNPSPSAYDFFGSSIAGIGSNRFVVGSYGKSIVGHPLCGQAYLYNSSGNLLGVITNPAPGSGDSFGCSIAAVGSNRVIVGAQGKNTSQGISAGQAYLYDLNGALVSIVTNPLPAYSDLFGGAVAGVGNGRFVVGAFGKSFGPNQYVGQAYLYDSSGVLLSVVTNPLPADTSCFGNSLASFGTNGFLVGAPLHSDSAMANVGAVYWYDLNGGYVATLTNPVAAAGDKFGFSMASLGLNRFLVGSPEKGIGLDQGVGQAYLYEMVASTPSLVADGVAPNAVGLSQLDTTSVDQRYVLKTGDSMSGPLHVMRGAPGTIPYANTVASLESSQAGYLSMLTPANMESGILFGNSLNNADAGVLYNVNSVRSLEFRAGGGGTRMLITSNGLVGIGVPQASISNRIQVVGGAYCTGAAWANASDRNLKTGFHPVDSVAVLEKVASLPVTTWRYKDEANPLRHMGPMAQDFHAAFALGVDDTSITTVDECGVALAAIQGLHAKISGQQAEIDRLRREHEAQCAALMRLERRLDTLGGAREAQE